MRLDPGQAWTQQRAQGPAGFILDAVLNTKLSAPYQSFGSKGKLEELQSIGLSGGIWVTARFRVARCERQVGPPGQE